MASDGHKYMAPMIILGIALASAVMSGIVFGICELLQ